MDDVEVGVGETQQVVSARAGADRRVLAQLVLSRARCMGFECDWSSGVVDAGYQSPVTEIVVVPTVVTVAVFQYVLRVGENIVKVRRFRAVRPKAYPKFSSSFAV